MGGKELLKKKKKFANIHEVVYISVTGDDITSHCRSIPMKTSFFPYNLENYASTISNS